MVVYDEIGIEEVAVVSPASGVGVPASVSSVTTETVQLCVAKTELLSSVVSSTTTSRVSSLMSVGVMPKV
ncbi:MAG: hypothetical protein GY822_17210 [Deltaproteobacteria bacterium]|nr:hypothetical protein [Deltaproteobacteria bacterium]